MPEARRQEVKTVGPQTSTKVVREETKLVALRPDI